MTYKEALIRLECEAVDLTGVLAEKPNKPLEIILDAINIAIEALEKTMWIPCSERLPDKNGNYLVTVSSYDDTASIEFICIDHCNSDGKFLHYENRKPRKKQGQYVIAWMPSPEPYKAGELE